MSNDITKLETKVFDPLQDVILTLQYCLETFEQSCQCGRCDPCTRGQEDIERAIRTVENLRLGDQSRVAAADQCIPHKYGPAPENVCWLEIPDSTHDAIKVEIFTGNPPFGFKALTVEFQTGDQTYWVRSHLRQEYMSVCGAADFSNALQFGVHVAEFLNAGIHDRPNHSALAT